MKITNFLALGICLLFGSCTMQKSTVQVNDKDTEWEWNKGTIVVKTRTTCRTRECHRAGSS